jgi:CheY-like chemotaxis protein
LGSDVKFVKPEIVGPPTRAAENRPRSADAKVPGRQQQECPVCPIEPPFGQFRILLAEDDDDMRSVVADALRGDGHEVVELADGGRLLVDIATRLKANGGGEPLDLIVSDIRMSICTGLQILEALRAAHWRTPVILMTAFGDDAARRHAESLSAVLFDKPFDLDNLRTAVANLLPRRRE